MVHKFQFKEAIAWLALLLALILFTFSVSFSQTQTVNVTNENGKVHVKIKKHSGDKLQLIDTTFSITDDKDLDRIISDLADSASNSKNEKNSSVNNEKSDALKKKKKIIIDVDLPEVSKEDMERIDQELRDAMNGLHKNLDELNRSLSEMRFHIGVDGDLNFEIPEIEYETDKMENNALHPDVEERGLADSLTDEDHFIIFGQADEQLPVLEKVIRTENGKQAFVYKRSASNKAAVPNGLEADGINNGLQVFPNPSEGKFTLRFKSDEKGDFQLKILDESGRMVYSRNIDNFRGLFEQVIDFTRKPKGNYIARISQGKHSQSVKVIVK